MVTPGSGTATSLCLNCMAVGQATFSPVVVVRLDVEGGKGLQGSNGWRWRRKTVGVAGAALLLALLMITAGGRQNGEEASMTVESEAVGASESPKEGEKRGVSQKLVGWLPYLMSERGCVPCTEGSRNCLNGCLEKCVPCFWGSDCRSGCRSGCISGFQ